MRAALLLAFLLLGCTQAPAIAPTSAPPSAAVSTTPTAATPTATSTLSPSPSASASPVAATSYTADDEAVATLIQAATEDAIPQLKRLNDIDPGQLEAEFLPLGEWIDSQRSGLAAYAPSSCTAAAVTLFMDGLDQYDAIRKKFLAWRDWGAHGHAFPPGAPGQVVATFTEALVELEAHCPTDG
jgi:hypothetical protein